MLTLNSPTFSRETPFYSLEVSKNTDINIEAKINRVLKLFSEAYPSRDSEAVLGLFCHSEQATDSGAAQPRVLIDLTEIGRHIQKAFSEKSTSTIGN